MPTHRFPSDDHIHLSPLSCSILTQSALGQLPQKCHPSLRLASAPNHEGVVVSRRGLSRLESPPPINRYAGDWSVCGRKLLPEQEADYDEVAGSESDGGKTMRSMEVQFRFIKNRSICSLSKISCRKVLNFRGTNGNKNMTSSSCFRQRA